jgi:urease accessory protein
LNRDVFLRLLQLADSGFPTGAFSFSQGLEGLADAGLLRSDADLTAVIRAQVEESLAGVELPALFHAHRAAVAGDVAALLAIDAYVSALKPVPALRAGSVKVGRRFVESAAPLLESPFLSAYRTAVLKGVAPGHHAVAFGAAMHGAGLGEAMAALAFGAGFVQGQTAAAVRLGLIGQAAAQRIIGGLHDDVLAAVARAERMALDDMGGYLPLVDFAGLRQATLPSRLFAS